MLRSIITMLAATLALAVGVAAAPSDASAHFKYSGCGYTKFSPSTVYYTTPSWWPQYYGNEVDNAAWWIREKTALNMYRSSSNFKIAFGGGNYGNNTNPAWTDVYMTGCNIDAAYVYFNYDLTNLMSQYELRSLILHELGHATGQVREDGSSEVNDGCHLRTIMQQTGWCRWTVMGINHMMEAHDVTDYAVVYGTN